MALNNNPIVISLGIVALGVLTIILFDLYSKGKERAETMKLTDNPFMILLGILSLGLGVVTFFDKRMATLVQASGVQPVAGLTIIEWAVVVLVVLIILWVFMGRNRSPVGLLLLALYLAYLFAINHFKLEFTYRDLILAFIPIAAGLFMIMGL